ncbi:MAG TPA: hypothetical protein VGN81_01895 [Pseudonocardiaceae bacterium]|jgi:hypothetical protein
MKRIALLAASVLALSVVAGGVADAAPQANSTDWHCGGQVCLRMLPEAVAKPADAHGCNGAVCVTVVGRAATGYSTSGSGYGFYGHVQVYGPNLQTTGAEAYNPVASGSGWGAGQTCAVGWQAVTGGGHTQVGKACETVS